MYTGEETRENITVLTDENILSAESYQVETVEPNIIIGKDETTPVPDMLLSMMPYSAIGRVRATYYDGTSGTGTGGPVATYSGTQLAILGEFMDTRDINYDWGIFHINSNIGNTKGYLGWNSNEPLKEKVTENPYFDATVIEIRETTVLVELLNEKKEMVVGTNQISQSLSIGELIKIEYDGEIDESIPPSITALRIEELNN